MKENNSNFHGASGACDALIYLLPVRLYCSHLSHGFDKILNKSNLRKERSYFGTWFLYHNVQATAVVALGS